MEATSRIVNKITIFEMLELYDAKVSRTVLRGRKLPDIKRMKTFYKILPFFILTVLNSCTDKENNIFWISEQDGHENDFLFMAESTNILPIKSDSLIYYLTQEEYVSAEKLSFKNFGEIYENENFTVMVLLKEASSFGRDYTFILRTFDNGFKIIDSYELATWIDSEERYCFGSINDDLIIKRTCDAGNEKDVRQIVNDGRIVATSFHGR